MTKQKEPQIKCVPSFSGSTCALEGTIDELIVLLNDKKKIIMTNHPDATDIRISIDTENNYGSISSRYEITFCRPETPEETETRLGDIQRREEREARERKRQWERLNAEFGQK